MDMEDATINKQPTKTSEGEGIYAIELLDPKEKTIRITGFWLHSMAYIACCQLSKESGLCTSTIERYERSFLTEVYTVVHTTNEGGRQPPLNGVVSYK